MVKEVEMEYTIEIARATSVKRWDGDINCEENVEDWYSLITGKLEYAVCGLIEYLNDEDSISEDWFRLRKL